MTLTADYLLGRTYSFTSLPTFSRGFMVMGNYHFTIVAVNAQTHMIRVHAQDKSRRWFTFNEFQQLFETGAIADARIPPYVWPREKS